MQKKITNWSVIEGRSEEVGKGTTNGKESPSPVVQRIECANKRNRGTHRT